MINVELYRFKVKPDKTKIVDEWLKFLNDNMEDTLLTLDSEKMYIESIHREFIDDVEYLYWYSIQGENGQNVHESTSYIDIKHLEYWNECIDETYTNNEVKTEVVMIPHKIKENMK